MRWQPLKIYLRRPLWPLSLFLGVGLGFYVQAEVYRFPVFPEPPPLTRPVIDLSGYPKNLRILNMAMGNYFGSTAIEFAADENGKGFHRSKTESIDFLRDAMKTIVHAQGCDAALRHQHLGQMFLDTALLGTPQRRIGIQALKEMSARDYLDPQQMQSYMDSAEGSHPDHFIFLESLSWIPASEVRAAFAGKIPWERIAEVDDHPGLSVESLKARAEAGAPGSILRLRRATLRIALGTIFTPQGVLLQTPLPFMEELRKTGRQRLTPTDHYLNFEFGRASQIPGMEGEALQLAGLASLVVAHHVMLAGGHGTDPSANVDKIYVHSLKPDRTTIYRRSLGAVPLAGLDAPNDTVLVSPLPTILGLTFNKTGLFAEVRALTPSPYVFDPAQWMRNVHEINRSRTYLLDWYVDQVNFTAGGPIILKASAATFKRILEARALSSGDPERVRQMFALILKAEAQARPQPLIAPAGVVHDQSVNALLPEMEAKYDYFLSGFAAYWAEKNPDYLKKLLFTIARQMSPDAVQPNPKILIVSKSFVLAEQGAKLGLKGFQFTGADHIVRYGLELPWDDLKAMIAVDPQAAETLIKDSRLNGSIWSTLFSLVNLDGLT